MQEEKKYGKCPECGAPCEVVSKMDFDGLIPTMPYDEFRYHQHPGTSVWVKASERLPEKDGYYCFKANGGYMGAYLRTASNGSRWWCDSAGGTIRNWKNCEWLDESPSKEGNKDREALANDAVEFAGWILENNIEATFNDKGKLWVDYRLPRGENKFTSAQLYELFKNRNNG